MLLRQTVLYLPAQVLAPLVQFASVLVWSHLLAPEQLGLVTLFVAMQEICYLLFFGWWSLSVLRFISGYTEVEARRSYLRTEAMAVGACLAVQTLVLAPIVFFAYRTQLDAAGLALVLSFMLTRSLNSYSADRARAEGFVLLYTLVQTVGPIIGFLFGLGCIWYFGPSSNAVLAGFILAQVIGALLSLAMSDFCRSLGPPSREILRKAAEFGSFQSISRLLAVIAMNVPRFAVSAMLGVAAVGLFSVGYSLGIRASSFAVTLVTAGAYPLVVKKMNTQGPEAAFAQLSQNMVLVAVAVIPVAFGLLGVNRSVVELLVAEQYREITLMVLPITIFGGLFRYLRAHTSDQVFLLNLKPGYGTAIAVLDLVVAVVSTILGIRYFGVVGAAIAPMASGLATLALSFTLSRFKFGFRAPYGAFARATLAGIATFASVFFLPVAENLTMLAAHVALGALVYALSLALLLRKEAMALIGKLTGRFRRKPAVASTGEGE
jgi:O-antigen/teichoic acid export membrane protein